LDSNFRIKHLYAHNNKIKTLDGSIANMPHIETLSLSNNELRDLDKNIEFLRKFTGLTQLGINLIICFILFKNRSIRKPFG